jgi:group I intron endonuclease
MDKICGIYKITSPSGRVYIGQSIDIKRRFKEYKKIRCKKQVRLYSSFKKYGLINHIFEVIEVCLEQELNTRERYWQDVYKVLEERGLNCKLTKTEDRSGKLSENIKLKISKSNKGLQNLSGDRNPMWGKKHSAESLQKMKTCKRSYVGESNPNFGKTGAMLGKKHTKKTIEKLKNMFSGGKNPAAKKVIDTETKIIYDSAAEAAIAFGINKYTLRRYLNNSLPNKTTLIYYKNDEQNNSNT